MRPHDLRTAALRRAALAEQLSALERQRKALQAEDRNLANTERALRRREPASAQDQRRHMQWWRIGVGAAALLALVALLAGVLGQPDDRAMPASAARMPTAPPGAGVLPASDPSGAPAQAPSRNAQAPGRAHAPVEPARFDTRPVLQAAPTDEDIRVLSDAELARISQADPESGDR